MKQAWITNDILDLCDDRRKIKEVTKTIPEMKDKHIHINIKIRNLLKKVKETLCITTKNHFQYLTVKFLMQF